MIELNDKKIIRVIPEDPDLMILTWVINNSCNNKCSYCLPELYNGKGSHYTWENAKKFLEILFERYPKIHCSVTGGEPSISYFFPELIKIFNDAGHSISTMSNAFKSVEYWENISKSLLSICFSYHPEFPVENFREKVIVSSFNTFVTARIMMLPSKWDHCIEVFNSLKDIDTCYTEAVRVLDYGGKNRNAHVYTKEQLNWFESENASKPNEKIISHLIEIKKSTKLSSQYQLNDGSILSGRHANPLQFINLGMTNFKGYVCEIGLKSLFVHSTGEIHLGNCPVGGIIGRVDEFEKIKWPTKPVICDVNLCHCATDVSIGKWDPNYDEYIQ